MPMFTFDSVKVIRIVDGDTFEGIVDCGFGIFFKTKFRLDRIDTAETHRPRNEAEKEHGLEAKKFLSDLILDKYIKVISKKKGKYGRYLADIYLGEKNIQNMMFEKNLQKRNNYEL